MFRNALVVAVFLAAPHLVGAEGLWGKVKDGASSAAGAVSDSAKFLTKEGVAGGIPEKNRYHGR